MYTLCPYTKLFLSPAVLRNEGDARGGAGSRSQAMSMHAQRNTRVDAEMALRVGRVQLVRNVWHAPIDQQGAADDHHLELSLLPNRSAEHTSELQSLMRISYAVFRLKKKHNRT